MLKNLKLAGFAMLMAFIATPAMAVDPLVDTGWVMRNLGKSGFVFLDVTGNPGAYAKGHIPGAVYTDYNKDKWRVDTEKNGRKVAGVLPPVDYLEKLIGALGIGNSDHVVIVANGFSAAEMGTATRLYWTFMVLGHDKVSILNGGMSAWLGNKANPLETEVNRPAPKIFKANFRDALIATTEEVRAALKEGVTMIDSRPTDQYLGINKSGKVRAYGTIPGAINVPGAYMTRNGGGEIRNGAGIELLYRMTNAPTSGPSITFCNTGHWASLGWFAEYALLGNKESAMYDGSMTEWTAYNDTPMERQVSLD